MIVLDATALLEFLLRRRRAHDVMGLMADNAPVALPDAVDAAVLDILRRYRDLQRLPAERGRRAVADLVALPATRYPTVRLASRAWDLSPGLHPSSTACLVLAEELGASLVTCDPTMVGIDGHRATLVPLL